MEKRSFSAIVKFYNYFMNSPEFKRLERVKQFREPVISATFSVLVGALILCIYSLIMCLKGRSPFDDRHVGLSIILFIGSTRTGTYEDLVQLKREIEYLIQKIIQNKTLTTKEPSHYIDTERFSIEIDRITSLLYSTSMKVFNYSFYNRLSKVLTEILGEFTSLTSHVVTYDSLKKCVEKVIFFDINILNVVPISHIHPRDDLAKLNSDRCVKDYGSIVKNSDLLKNNCYEFLIRKHLATNPEDLEWLKAKDLFDKDDFIFNSLTVRSSYGLTCSEMDKRIVDFRKKSEKEKNKDNINWIY